MTAPWLRCCVRLDASMNPCEPSMQELESLDFRMAKAVAAVLRESKLPRDVLLKIEFQVKIQSDGKVQISEMAASQPAQPNA